MEFSRNWLASGVSAFSGSAQHLRDELRAAVETSDISQVVDNGLYRRQQTAALCFHQNAHDTHHASAKTPSLLARVALVQDKQVGRQFLRQDNRLRFACAKFLAQRQHERCVLYCALLNPW